MINCNNKKLARVEIWSIVTFCCNWSNNFDQSWVHFQTVFCSIIIRLILPAQKLFISFSLFWQLESTSQWFLWKMNEKFIYHQRRTAISYSKTAGRESIFNGLSRNWFSWKVEITIIGCKLSKEMWSCFDLFVIKFDGIWFHKFWYRNNKRLTKTHFKLKLQIKFNLRNQWS